MKTTNIFKDLSSISVKDKTEKKGKFSYLSWASAWNMIKSEHPTAQRVVYESEHTGLNFFTDGKRVFYKFNGERNPTINCKGNCYAWIRIKFMDWRGYCTNYQAIYGSK